jgi:hypothetical protein
VSRAEYFTYWEETLLGEDGKVLEMHTRTWELTEAVMRSSGQIESGATGLALFLSQGGRDFCLLFLGLQCMQRRVNKSLAFNGA